jgi:hypothetical protein
LPKDCNSQPNVTQTGNSPYTFITGAEQEHAPYPRKIANHHEHHEPKKFSDLRLQDRCMIWLTLGILIIGGVTARILSKQFAEMSNQTLILETQEESDSVSGSLSAVQIQKQLSLAQKQLDASQEDTYTQLRPWIGPKEITLEGTIENQSVFSIWASIENFGHTPAVVDSYIVEYWLRKPPFPDNPSYYIGEGGPISSHQVLFPGESMRSRPMKGWLYVAQLANVIQDRQRMYVYGEITYSDALRPKIKHHTQFCGFYDSPTKAFNGCPNYQKAD